MTIVLTAALMKSIYPNISEVQSKAFVDRQAVMANILDSEEATALCFANMYAETSGFALAGLTENIHYTAARMAAVWPNRFKSAAAVEARYGTAAGWQNAAFNEIYGNRMGNRPNTHDGSWYIGRGGPQLTGRDEYETIGDMIKVDLINNPNAACRPELQPDIVAAYWQSKNLDRFIGSVVDIVGARKVWNGGTNGLDVVQKQYPRILKLLSNHLPVTAAISVQLPTAKKDALLEKYQLALIQIGYKEVGDADGLIGGKTLGVIKMLFVDRGIDAKAEYPSKSLDDQMLKIQNEGWHRPISPSRAFKTEAELAPALPSIQHSRAANLWTKVGGFFSLATAGVQGAVSFMPQAQQQASPVIDMVKGYYADIPGWIFPIVIGCVAFMIYRETTKSKAATVADFQTGKIN